MTGAAAAPIIKWAGGKTQLLPELLRRVPMKYSRYFEPFCGGAALFFRLAPQHAVLSDVNTDLIALYEITRDQPQALIRALARHAKTHSKEHFYATRLAWNAGKGGKVARAAMFVYLNKTCFNGLWRVNRDGEFNVPMGDYKDPKICAPEVLRNASLALRQVELRHADFRTAVGGAARNDFVYFDPPYDPVTATSNFTGYAAGSFSSQDQQDLAECAHYLVNRGVYVLLSNSDTPFIRKLYKGFKIDRVKCSRSINSAGKKRGKVNELIIAGRL